MNNYRYNMVNYPETIITKSEGYNDSEKRLIHLCNNTFLSLWSYPNLFRNQGKSDHNKKCGKGDGKELCDLLVIYGNDIIIFSDKKCDVPVSDDISLNWTRWYKRAIFDSAKQIFGAERWIFKYPDNIFVDKNCTVPFPLEIPKLEDAHIHRIVISHGISDHIKKNVGGSGSLRINPSIIDEVHFDCKRCTPFTIGQIDSKKGFIHVLDDVTLDIVMTKLDTITDFLNYLKKKEDLIINNKLLEADGEEDLLAHYLMRINSAGEHSFFSSDENNDMALRVESGLWNKFLHHPSYMSQYLANDISYTWDRLIEKFFFHIMNGTAENMSHPSLGEQEKLFRWLANENRTRRRLLGQSIIEFMQDVPDGCRGTRVVCPSTDGDPLYVFLIFPRQDSMEDEIYRKIRKHLLMDYLAILKYDFQHIDNFIGIATENYNSTTRSEDITYLDTSTWSGIDLLNASKLKKEYIENGLLSQRNMQIGQVNEYPEVENDNKCEKLKGKDRNMKCPCGSGKKVKKCCMKI